MVHLKTVSSHAVSICLGEEADPHRFNWFWGVHEMIAEIKPC